MRQLHVLGVSEDGKTLLLGASKNAAKPTHRIAIDDRVKAATAGRLAPLGSDRTEPELSPKEMQARLREGATVEEVAKAAGVPPARVQPYAVPVEAERDRIIEQARLALMQRHRGPSATKPLGFVVDAHLMDVGGIKPDSIAWTARRRRDGAWVVAVTYNARGRRKAEWLWQPVGRELTPLDPAAARLGADAPAAPKRRTTTKPAAKPAAKKQPAKKASRPAAKRAAAKPVTKKAAPPRAAKAATASKATKAASVKAAKPAKPAKKATVKRAAPAPAPKVVPKVVQEAAPPVKVVRPRRPRIAVAVPVEPVDEPQVIQLPVTPLVEEPVVIEAPAPVEQETSEEPAARQEQPPRKPGQRVPLPSWDDVLLGVSKGDRRSG